MTFTATYDPADDKIRISASQRLDKDLYARVKTAGFGWAPKQEVFYAVWSPRREDLALELAGDIGDEDTSLVDRAEERAERFDGYRENRTADAERAKDAVSRIADNIPFGQPILVGHHSEKHARKDAERIENGMRKAVKMWETANYWKSRAAGAIQAAKYKELPAVRARRIKTIEAEMRSLVAGYTPHENQRPIMQHADDSTLPYDERPIVPFVWVGPKGRGGHWVMQSRLAAIEAGSRRYLAHLENRLLYERAMLAEGGGLAADGFDIQIGGRVCRRGEWFVVSAVNRKDGAILSVSIFGHWAGTIPIEDVKDYRAPETGDAEKVKAAKKLPPLVNFRAGGCVEMTTAEWKQRCKYSDSYFVANYNTEGGLAKTGMVGEGGAAYRQRSTTGRGATYTRVPVFLTDAKVAEPPSAPAAKAEPVSFSKPLPTRDDRPAYRAPETTEYDLIKDSLRAGVQTVSAPQLFPTPSGLAARVAELAGGVCLSGLRILEPSAGTGNLIKAAVQAATGFDCVRVCAVEINPSLVQGLERYRQLALYGNESRFEIVQGDFLAQNGNLGKFDRIIMNPPFVNGADIKHIQHAVTFLKPGGRLVAICANGPRQQEALRPLADHWEELPTGTFSEQGTNVNTALLVISARLEVEK